jgi:hypothetical protein
LVTAEVTGIARRIILHRAAPGDRTKRDRAAAAGAVQFSGISLAAQAAYSTQRVDRNDNDLPLHSQGVRAADGAWQRAVK